jgi:hypothetical protein
MVMNTNLQKQACIRGTEFPAQDRQRLAEMVESYGIVQIAKAADTSVQSIAKALSGLRLYESTQRRIRSVLPKSA